MELVKISKPETNGLRGQWLGCDVFEKALHDIQSGCAEM